MERVVTKIVQSILLASCGPIVHKCSKHIWIHKTLQEFGRLPYVELWLGGPNMGAGNVCGFIEDISARTVSGNSNIMHLETVERSDQKEGYRHHQVQLSAKPRQGA